MQVLAVGEKIAASSGLKVHLPLKMVTGSERVFPSAHRQHLPEKARAYQVLESLVIQ